MSIRLRLSLLYSAILTLTLVIFGVVLYTIQAQDSLKFLKQDLLHNSGRVVDSLLHEGSKPPQRDSDGLKEIYPSKEFDEFFEEKTFQDVREREILRILDQNGNLLASPLGRVEDALPLSKEGFSALQNQQEWWEENEYAEEEMLIYSNPVIQDGQILYIVQIARSLTERNQALNTLATTLGGAGIIVVLMAFGVGWALSGIALRPISKIAQTAQRIGDDHDFTRRVDYVGPEDEVGHLANTFNQMLSRLQDAYQKVEHSLDLQRNFVADVSHELRTPLTTLRGNLGLLHRKPTAEMQYDILVDMVDESDRLIRLVNDLLLLARADAGRSLAKSPLDLSPVLKDSARQARQLDDKRTINLSIKDDCMILGDRDALKQVMLILLDNALKHSDGNIDILTQKTAKKIQISVQDHGEGIPPETITHIFDRFYRGEESAITPGFGLGLPIAKALVEGMRGEITIDSVEGKGSTVTLYFLYEMCS